APPSDVRRCIRDRRGVLGLHIEEALHRFQVVTRPPGAPTPMPAGNVVGECLGTGRQRWLMAPDDLTALPDVAPPPTPLDAPPPDQPLPRVEPRPRPESGVTYLVFRGEAVHSDHIA